MSTYSSEEDKNKKLQELTEQKMELLFDENEVNSIFQNGHSQREHDEKLNSKTKVIDRLLKSKGKLKKVSTLEPYDQNTLVTTLMDEMQKITEWLDSSSEQYLELYATADHFIGSGIKYENGKLIETKTKETKIILKKDNNANKSGYVCLTAYPDIGKYAKTTKPTNRNILPDLIHTHSFKEADTAQRTKWINDANRGRPQSQDPNTRIMDQVYDYIITHSEFDPETMDIQSTDTEIKLQEHTCRSIIQSKSIVYHPDENTVKTNTPTLYRITEQTRTRIGLNKPATQPEKKQNQPPETTMANGLSHTPTKIPKNEEEPKNSKRKLPDYSEIKYDSPNDNNFGLGE